MSFGATFPLMTVLLALAALAAVVGGGMALARKRR